MQILSASQYYFNVFTLREITIMLITEITNQFFFIYSDLAFLSSRVSENKDRLIKIITDLFSLICSLLTAEFAEFDCLVVEIMSSITFQSLFS